MMMGGHSAMSDSVPRWFCYAHPKLIPEVVAYLLHYDRHTQMMLEIVHAFY